MDTKLRFPWLFGLLCCLQLGAARAEPPAEARMPSEPLVENLVVEDDSTRIDELRVRGESQRIEVTPKGRFGARYEILTVRNGNTRGNAGQRVWNVLSF